MSLLVFVGVYAIGNPVDILINPQADQAEIERAIAALGLDRPLWEQYLIFLKQALAGDLGSSFVYNDPGDPADPGAHAGDAGTGAGREADRGARSAFRSACGRA